MLIEVEEIKCMENNELWPTEGRDFIIMMQVL